MNILVCDANSLYARSWFAAEHMGAEPVEAISLMVRTLLLLINPNVNKIGIYFDALYFAWDAKQNPLKERDPKPQSYHETKEIAKDVLTLLFNATHYQHDGYEGDDIVATVVYQSEGKDVIYIVSADKDLQQLMSKNVRYYCLNTKAELSADFVVKKWNIRQPSQVALSLAIVGDPVDNIKGVKGFGPAKCKKLFAAVTPEMNLEEAAEVLIKQLPADKVDQFIESLDRTLLKHDVPGVERPARLRLARPKVAQSLDLPRIDDLYEEVYEAYNLK